MERLRRGPTTAFVLSGGASLGAVQVGMLQGLAEHGITPDLVIGTSVGAINAGWIAGDPGLRRVHELAEVWRSMRTRDVFPLRPLAGFLGFVGRRDYLVPPRQLRALLARHLRFDRLEDAPVPAVSRTTPPYRTPSTLVRTVSTCCPPATPANSTNRHGGR